MFESLNSDIIEIITKKLNTLDKVNFLSVNKRMRLSKPFFLENTPCVIDDYDEEKIRYFLDNKIKISLNLVYNHNINLSLISDIESLSISQKNDIFRDDDLIYFSRIKEVYLWKLDIYSINLLKNVKSLSLYSCNHITNWDISGGKIEEIYIYNIDLERIKINSFKDVQNISLVNCITESTIDLSEVITTNTKYFEISNSKNLTSLLNLVNFSKYLRMSFIGCLNLVDINTLSNIYELNLSNCYSITDFNRLGTINTLILDGTNIQNVYCLRNVYNLSLSMCLNIEDFSSLGKVHTLDVSHTNISDVSNMAFVYSLNLSGCPNVIDISMLGNLHTLNLTDCYNIINYCSFEKIKNYFLPDCNKIWGM